jgi:internalin A
MTPDSLKQLIVESARAKLGALTLTNRHITELPVEIALHTFTRELILKNNQLTTLPVEIGELEGLRVLDVSNNSLTSLAESIGQLSQLERLDLSNNELAVIPSTIGRLSKLLYLDLSDNNLTSLPVELTNLTELKALYLKGNPIPIPPEIVARSSEPRIILNYYHQHQTGLKRSLNEAKMLLVGQSSVGKTSLVRRLLHGTFDIHEGKTEGISINTWTISCSGRSIKLNTWDFGGQEIMHATHQFFLTKRSVYLLVLDSRVGEVENRIEYWLKIIQSFGGDSPVIVVGNKTDQHPLDLDRTGLQAKYKNIKAFVEISCKTGAGLQELTNVLSGVVGSLEHLNDELLLTWFAVKTRLEDMSKGNEDYLSYQQYRRICEEQYILDDLSQRTLVSFLHDLGIILNFQDDPRLEDTNILNPEWVTNGVYRILNSNVLMTEYKGMLDWQKLSSILDSKKYPKEKHLFIIDMMRKFELCFTTEGKLNEKFLIPDLLTKQEPYTGDWARSLSFQYHYYVLPGSVFSRFMVRISDLIYQDTFWRNGVVLAFEKNKALVKADKEEKIIFVWIGGPTATRRNLLEIIRREFDYVHKTIPGIEFQEKLCVSNDPELLVGYGHLISLERAGIIEFIPEGATKKLNVKDVLDGFESREERKSRAVLSSYDTKQYRPPPKWASTAKTHSKPENPWRAGLFYLLALVVIMVVIAIISTKIHWSIVPIVICGGVVCIAVVGALQLRQDNALSETSFLSLMIQSFSRLPLVKLGTAIDERRNQKLPP